MGLHLQGSLSSCVNLTFILRKLTSLGMYQERSQKRGSKCFRLRDESVCASGPEERAQRLSHITLVRIHVGHTGTGADARDPQGTGEDLGEGRTLRGT